MADHVYRTRGALVEWDLVNPDAPPPPPPPPPDPGVSEWEIVTRLFARLRDTEAAPPEPPEPLPDATLSLTFVSPTGSVRSNVTGLHWAFYYSTDFPALLNTPPSHTGTATLASDGTFSVVLEDSTVGTGQTGWLIISNSDGTAEQNPPSLAFCAPVVVD
jgi:hypothetical protein